MELWDVINTHGNTGDRYIICIGDIVMSAIKRLMGSDKPKHAVSLDQQYI